MPYIRYRTRNLLVLASVWLVTGCAGRVQTSLSYPPVADLRAAIEPKPIATPDIVTSDQANADYSLAVELWGDRVSSAGGRICRWVVETGGKLPFKCPKP